ncbi:MAG TPA: hypothetical protein PKW17_11340 [Smithellaceae bacterium]|nr:hypothetical protein [Smithellaceae bacterium]
MAGNKITRLKLEATIEELIVNGITTSVGISAALKEKGYNVSQPTVSRYLHTVQQARQEEAQQIVNRHVQEKLPSDLTALETMEKQCLDWAGENNDVFAHRLAERHIVEAAPAWAEQIIRLAGGEPKEKILALKAITTQCLSWIADDLEMQKARLAAMRQAANIIEMKVKFALGNKDEGGIYIVDRSRGDQLVKDEQSGGLMVIPGGQE